MGLGTDPENPPRRYSRFGQPFVLLARHGTHPGPARVQSRPLQMGLARDPDHPCSAGWPQPNSDAVQPRSGLSGLEGKRIDGTASSHIASPPRAATARLCGLFFVWHSGVPPASGSQCQQYDALYFRRPIILARRAAVLLRDD